jgi:Ser/Thr protein kinase RdoA (MazF antagonist)
MAADGLRESIARPANDAATILEQAVGAAARALWDRPEAVHYLEHCARQLQPLLTTLPTAPPAYGLIHGDAIRANALVDAQEQVTLIDFDLCGPGLRAYDLASYLLTIRGTAQEAVFIEAFLAGYTAWRSLSQAEYGLLPVFEAVRAIFDIGVPATYVDQWGSGYLYAVLDPALAQVRRCMAQLG